MFSKWKYGQSCKFEQETSEGFFRSYLQIKKKNGEYIVPVVYLTFQLVSGYKSAIKDHFTTDECEIKPDDDEMLRNILGGNQRKIANLKQNGVMPVVEGK